jgi:hypothetical protein
LKVLNHAIHNPPISSSVIAADADIGGSAGKIEAKPKRSSDSAGRASDGSRNNRWFRRLELWRKNETTRSIKAPARTLGDVRVGRLAWQRSSKASKFRRGGRPALAQSPVMAPNIRAHLVSILPGRRCPPKQRRADFIKVLDGGISVVDLNDAKI